MARASVFIGVSADTLSLCSALNYNRNVIHSQQCGTRYNILEFQKKTNNARELAIIYVYKREPIYTQIQHTITGMLYLSYRTALLLN